MVNLGVSILTKPDGSAQITPVVWRDDNATPDEEWLAREFERLVRGAVKDVADGLTKRRTGGGAPESIEVPAPPADARGA